MRKGRERIPASELIEDALAESLCFDGPFSRALRTHLHADAEDCGLTVFYLASDGIRDEDAGRKRQLEYRVPLHRACYEAKRRDETHQRGACVGYSRLT